MTVLAVQIQARTQCGNLSPKGSILGFQRLNLASKAMTKSFDTDMSFDNSMNQVYLLKHIYIKLNCVAKF